ncbi:MULTISPECIES: FMN-binding protein [Brenneria]|uniref:FMN-binding protein n=1 Tax=Brenneria nigrifluens DSM 30175 = ATCC 13028 TaxID=1121120 RepID=A0A2U1USY2_9GAMM|nr:MULTISPECIES: FMN-binding protein [Brenneria]EHD21689.1 FMN-binding domain protein [Brenneria sp. EniD312]PWC24773.1 FMN-binding protein [Brenneria nigrifluens] [Brenneria nigrifluens DSM 30175 = ATCC 13028]QCR04804.1 FMN-binding protein [Brenneria nigrifluens] [Brenneria nigrifluens DSM 30175 = ATCC 13028]
MQTKLLAGILTGLFAVTAFAADGIIKDGTYKAETINFDDHGWKPFVELTYKDGKIAGVKFDYTSEKDGHLKTSDKEYGKKMASVAKTSPEVYTVKLAQSLLEKQNIEDVDGVTGATHSTEDFKILAGAAIENAKAGNTETAKIE